MNAAHPIITPDPTGEIHQSRGEAGAPVTLAEMAEELDRLDTFRAPLEAAWWGFCKLHEGSEDPVERDRIADALDPVDDSFCAMIGRAPSLPATTMVELAAKARLLRYEIMSQHTTHNDPETICDPGLTLALSLCDDLERLARREAAS